MRARTRIAGAGGVISAVVVGGLLVSGGTGGVIPTSGRPSAAASPAAAGVATTAVVRTNLVSTTQVGGSLGYAGAYTVVNPAGASAQQLTQAQQAVTQAQQTLTADQTAQTDAAASSAQSIVSAQATVNGAKATLTADQDQQRTDCATGSPTTSACGSDGQKVLQDEAQVTEADDALKTAQLGATSSSHQDQAKVTADNTQLQNSQAALATLEQTAADPGTTYTALPTAGQVISQGQALYATDGEPVTLLYGRVPAWRAFRAGMPNGADVDELTQDLIALGYGAGLTPSDAFSAATAAAVVRWQAALGVPQTGVVLLGQVVFEPAAVRVTTVMPHLGQTVSPGPVLDASGTTRVVTVALSVNQEYLVKSGNAVNVVLPDGSTTIPGRVQSVSTVAQSSNDGSGAGPTVTVTVTLDNPAASGNLDQAPVNVDITTQTADHALAVPISALLALEEGGDAVEVVSGATRHLVGVQTGLFSNTLVQISGPGIEAGTRVEVPSS